MLLEIIARFDGGLLIAVALNQDVIHIHDALTGFDGRGRGIGPGLHNAGLHNVGREFGGESGLAFGSGSDPRLAEDGWMSRAVVELLFNG